MRGDDVNSGVAAGSLSGNPGVIRYFFDLTDLGATLSSPAVGIDGTIYVGTASGLVVLAGTEDPDTAAPSRCALSHATCAADGDCATDDSCATPLKELWRFTGYRAGTRCEPCEPDRDPDCAPVGAVVSSPAVTVNGDLLFGTEAGKVFAFHQEGSAFTCRWSFDGASGQPIRSSALPLADFDENLGSVYLGTGRFLQALNGDGTFRWRTQLSNDTDPPGLTSSPATSNGNLYMTSPEGTLYALDGIGRVKWQFSLGLPVEGLDFLPSPVAPNTIFALGTDRGRAALVAVNPDGTLRWRYLLDSPVHGSAAIGQRPLPTNQATPAPTNTWIIESLAAKAPAEEVESETSTPTPSRSTTPSPTPTPTLYYLDTMVYVVDEAGTLRAVRGSTGTEDARTELGGHGFRMSPVVSDDGFVVVLHDDGVLSAWKDGAMQPCDFKCSLSDTPCETEAQCPSGETCVRGVYCGDDRWNTYLCSSLHCAGAPDVECATDTECALAGPCRPLPCPDSSCPNPGEACHKGRIFLGGPAGSSPAIDQYGRIYATTSSGYLYVVGAPRSTPTVTAVASETATQTPSS